MQNPFLYGSPVEGGCFINRVSEIRELSSDLERNQNVVIYSPRRYGKTSLIKAVIKQLEKKHIQCFYMDILHITTTDSFIDYYSRAIIKQLKSPAEKVFGWAKGQLSSLRLGLELDEEGKTSLNVGIGKQPKSDLPPLLEILDFVDRFMKHEKKKACIVFDEFQEIEMVPESDKLQKQLRASFQHHKNVSYAFLGSKQHLLSSIFKDSSKPFYNFCKHHHLEVIPLKDWKQYIDKSFKNGGLSIPEDLPSQIFEITQGHPYYMQLFCSLIWELFVEEKHLPKDYIQKTINHALRNQQHAYNEIWDRLSMKQRQLVAAIAQEKEAEIYSGPFLSKFSYTTPATLQRAAQKLLQDEILIRNASRVQIADPIFRLWLTAFDYQFKRPGIFTPGKEIP